MALEANYLPRLSAIQTSLRRQSEQKGQLVSLLASHVEMGEGHGELLPASGL